MSWQELTKIALLGTENSTFSAHTLQSLQAQGIDINKEAPLILAESAALFAQMRKAGFLLENFAGPMPEAAPVSGEKYGSLKTVRHLNLILEGKFTAVLPEFIQHLLESGKVFPAEQLPSLMQHPSVNQYWEMLEQVIGEGGRWLLSQHPEWRKRIENAENHNWQTGTKEERISLLQHLRRSDPVQALEMLQSTWEQEDFRDKAAFLNQMEWGLSMDDEDFLEKCLEEGRKEVRLEAAKLLALLPDSSFVNRMYSRAMTFFRWNSAGLNVHIPDEMIDGAMDDGLLKVHPAWQGGAKAGYLGQVAGYIPPQHWELFFDKTPAEILKLFALSDWGDTLIKAVAEAVVFHRNKKWLEALVDFWFENENLLPRDSTGIQLLKLVSPRLFNRISIKYIKNGVELPEDTSLVFSLLQQNKARWDDELSRLIVYRIKAWILKAKQPQWQTYHYREYLKMAGIHSNPALLDEFQKDWPRDTYSWAFWEKTVEEMLNTLLFRQEMIAALQERD